MYQGERVAQAIREHQTSPVTGWEYGDLVKQLHDWCERVDRDFDLGVPTPIIAVAPLRRRVLGTYTLGQNGIGIGARTTITVNERYLPLMSFAQVVIVAVHELLHGWDEWRNGRSVGGLYHSVEWRRKMKEVGIIADEYGHTVRVLPVFVDYLKRYGVADIRFRASDTEMPKKRRQMPKWMCGCPSGYAVRAMRLHARCEDCHKLFKRAED